MSLPLEGEMSRSDRGGERPRHRTNPTASNAVLETSLHTLQQSLRSQSPPCAEDARSPFPISPFEGEMSRSDRGREKPAFATNRALPPSPRPPNIAHTVDGDGDVQQHRRTQHPTRKRSCAQAISRRLSVLWSATGGRRPPLAHPIPTRSLRVQGHSRPHHGALPALS